VFKLQLDIYERRLINLTEEIFLMIASGRTATWC